MTGKITFTLDGKRVEALPDETIWQVAQRQGTAIPHLCYAPEPGYRADGNCRACMVEIEGERVLAASCIRNPVQDMVVNTASEEATSARRMVMEMLVADQPARDEIDEFEPEFTVINLPSFKADPERHGCRTETVIALNFSKKFVIMAF
mgnify:CR=1 FL=1